MVRKEKTGSDLHMISICDFDVYVLNALLQWKYSFLFFLKNHFKLYVCGYVYM